MIGNLSLTTYLIIAMYLSFATLKKSFIHFKTKLWVLMLYFTLQDMYLYWVGLLLKWRGRFDEHVCLSLLLIEGYPIFVCLFVSMPLGVLNFIDLTCMSCVWEKKIWW